MKSCQVPESSARCWDLTHSCWMQRELAGVISKHFNSHPDRPPGGHTTMPTDRAKSNAKEKKNVCHMSIVLHQVLWLNLNTRHMLEYTTFVGNNHRNIFFELFLFYFYFWSLIDSAECVCRRRFKCRNGRLIREMCVGNFSSLLFLTDCGHTTMTRET